MRCAALCLAILAVGGVAASAWGSQGTAHVRLAVRADPPVPFGIYRIDPGGKPVRLSTSRQDEYPAWSPDGKSVAFDQAIKPGNPKSDCRLAVVAAGGGASHAVPGVTAACRAFSWGRNGLIAFNDPKNAVWVVKLDGSGLRKLVGASADALNPAWSPDGRLLAFGNGVFGGLQVVGSNGKGLHAITNPQAGPADGYPAWSPDGKTIAFARTNPTDFTVSIMVARPDGTGIRRLVKLMQDVSVARPSWTPDGSSIVYADPFGIAFVPVAGGAHRILVHGMYDQPAVAPK